jgi:hypothetical protein
VRERLRSRPFVACIGVCALIVAVAGADLAHTESRLPDVSPRACEPGASSCFNAQLSEQLARQRAAVPLQDQYDSRAWLYVFAILATVVVAVGYRLRTSPRTEWLRVFSDLGVAGVWVGIVAVVLLLVTHGSSVKPPPPQTLMLPVALLVAAAAGTLVSRSEGWAVRSQADEVRDRAIQIGKFAIHVGTAGQARQSRLDELARWLSNAALALTALTCLLAFVFVVGQPGCDTNASPPDWTDPIDSVAAVTAIGGMAAGVGTLLLRRWIAALISLVLCPVALLFVLASTCAFY